MGLLIQKFGGTSVATVPRIQHAAQIVATSVQQGHQVIVVVSAMGDFTDQLQQSLDAIASHSEPREQAALLSSGEQISASLMSVALSALNLKSKSYNARQIGLVTQASYHKSRVLGLDCPKLRNDIESGIVPVVTGYQGVNDDGDITTLGRGGSDLTAVALAAFLNADECQIFSDVEGVFTADPRIVETAKVIDEMHYDEMLAFATLGARVLQSRSVEMARKHAVPLRVLSSFKYSPGTLIHEAFEDNERVVTGITYVDEQVKVTLNQVTDAEVDEITSHLLACHIDVDMLTRCDHVMSFTIDQQALVRLCQLTHDFHIQSGVAKISLVGQGMQMHAGFAATIIQLLAQQHIHIHSIFSTSIKVTILVDSIQSTTAVNLLYEKFFSAVLTLS